MRWPSTQTTNEKSINPNGVNNALFDLLSKLNVTEQELQTIIANLNVPTVVESSTYGRFRDYPDGTTQGRTLTSSVVESAAIALTTGVVANIVSLTIPAGSWVFSCFLRIDENTTTTHIASGAAVAAISRTSATLPAADTGAVPTNGEIRLVERPGNATVGAMWQLGGGAYRVDLDEDTTFYLVARDTFAVSTSSAFGWFQAISIL